MHRVFSFLILIINKKSRENIKRVTFELLEDAQKENVKYIEVRFAPLLHLNGGLI